MVDVERDYAVLERLPGMEIAPDVDLLCDEFHALSGAPGRWLFVRFHRDGSAAVIRAEVPADG